MKVSIVGGGVSGLFCAYHLVKNQIEVELFEKESSLAKKFLVAGKSGLNITSSSPKELFHNMYFEHSDLFKDLLCDFNADDTINWLKELGHECFVGSSYKVFPKEFKAAKILKDIKDFLQSSNLFELHLLSEFTNLDDQYLIFKDKKIKYEKAIFCLGGASWSKTGSDGKWIDTFKSLKIKCNDFKPSNCSFKTKIKLDDRLPLKNISMSFKDITLKGESLLFNEAIEGGVLYHLSSYIRDEITSNSVATIHIDFKPGVTRERIVDQLQNKKSKTSWSNHIKKVLKLDKDILNFITNTLTKDEYFDVETLANSIKSFSLDLELSNDIDLAISTGGGVSFDSLNSDFSLVSNENVYVCGEMIDWEAPTGGFLIQGCYSIGHRIVQSLIKR